MKSGGETEYLCVGVGSKQYNGTHALFLDLDSHSEHDAVGVAREIINNYAVSDCYIVRSSNNNHHLVCLDLFDFGDVKKIAEKYAHKAWSKFRGFAMDFVIRTSAKLEKVDTQLLPVLGTEPFLACIVKSPFNYRKKSEPLRLYFSRKWEIDIKKDKNFTKANLHRFHVYRCRMGDDNGKEEKT
jgi:hypothetical protein